MRIEALVSFVTFVALKLFQLSWLILKALEQFSLRACSVIWKRVVPRRRVTLHTEPPQAIEHTFLYE